jgi:thiosulfate reductase cytochrome b subunit
MYPSRENVLPRLDKHTLQTLGFALIVLGFLLVVITVLGGPGFYNCPANGCPPGTFQWYWVVSTIAFFSGIAFILSGIILLIIARGLKPKRETETVNRGLMRT